MICTKCRIDKPREEFAKDKRTPAGLRSACKNCLNAQAAKYRVENAAAVKESQRMSRSKNIDAYRGRNREDYVRNADVRRAKIKEYQQFNPEWMRGCRAKHRARKRNACPEWLTVEQLEDIKKIYKSCPDGFHVDHIVPLNGKSVCGLHVPWNLQHLPAEENMSKGNSHE